MWKHTVSVGVLGMAIVAVGACGGGGSESAETSTVTVAPTTMVQTGADWKYLQTQYSDLLGRECYSGPDSGKTPLWRACVGLQHNDMESLYRDAQTLPMSKDRVDLLRAIEDFQRDFDKWNDNMCGMGDTSDVARNVSCQLLPLQMSFTYDTVTKIINNNAGT